MNRSFAKQAILRLAWSLVFLCVLIATMMVISRSNALQGIAHEHVESLLALYKTEWREVEKEWKTITHTLKTGIEFSRILERQSLVEEHIAAFLITQGIDQRLQHLIIQDGKGHRVFDFGDPIGVSNIPLQPEEKNGYYLDHTTEQLYRVLQESIWLGEKQGTGRIAVFFRIDNALLYSIDGRNTTLTLFYNDQPVASSAGQTALNDSPILPKAENEEIRDFFLLTKADEVIRLRLMFPAMSSVSTTRFIGEMAAILFVAFLLFSRTIGFWLLRQTRRIAALGNAINEFSAYHSITSEMEKSLRQAQGKHTDEITQVAQIIMATAHATVNNHNERVQYRQHLEKLVEERTEQLSALHYRNQLILDTVGDGICGLDHDGHIIFSNPATSRILGWSSEEMVGKIFHDRCHHSHPDGTPYPREECETHVKLSQCVIVHVDMTTFWRRDGTPFLAEVTATPLIEEGVATGEVLIFRDITELQSARREKQLNTAKSEFLANMSHEIRTPMNTIIGMGHLLAQTPLDPRQRDQVRKMQAAGQSLLRIIDDILDFSKIEANKLHLEQVAFELSDVIEKVSAMIAVHAEEKGLEILFDIPMSTPQILLGDPFRLEQILINLGTNAVKFSASGDILYQVRDVSSDDQQIVLRFSVQDHGIGLSTEQMGKLFQAFSQADTSTTRHYGGTGLGLAICKRLVEMMGGQIWVESVLGQGSCFGFTAVFAKPALTPRRHYSEVASRMQKARILIVDDNPIACDIVDHILQDFVSSTHAVHSGASALLELEQATKENNPYQVVLLDWKMHEMDGLETARRIILHPHITQPTVIMMTAFGSQEIVRQSIEIGIDRFMIKPITPSLLLNNLMDVFGTDPNQVYDAQQTTVTQNTLQLHGMRVLVVEDHDINWQVAEGILSNAGVFAQRAANGQEAIKIIVEEKQHYDVVFMDLQMPIMDGYEATQLLRKQFSATELPIVAMTAHAITLERERCFSLGMNDYLTKPVDVKGLYTLLAQFRSEHTKPAHHEPIQIIPKKRKAALPETLPGIDLQQGLQRLDGDESLLASLIMSFSKQYVGVDASFLRELLEAGKIEEIQRFLHKLKGAAGTISARAIHDLSVACEKELTETGDIAESRLRRLEERLEKVRDAEQRIVEHLAEIEQHHPSTPLSTPLLEGWSEALRQGLSTGDFHVTEQCHILLPSLRGKGVDAEVNGLRDAVNVFDFKTALVCLRRIEEMLGK